MAAFRGNVFALRRAPLAGQRALRTRSAAPARNEREAGDTSVRTSERRRIKIVAKRPIIGMDADSSDVERGKGVEAERKRGRA